MISNEDYDIRFCGVYKTCPMCGKRFFVSDTAIWAYKRSIRKGERAYLIYFDKWSCLSNYEKKYEEDMRKKRSDAVERARRNRKVKQKHLCFECDHNKIGPNEKHFCELDISRYVFPKKEACKQFCIKEES